MKNAKESIWKVFWGLVGISFVFVVIIGLLGWRFDSITLLPDQGASWYYWKLPERDSLIMLIVWAFYLLHQIFVWILIYLSQFGNKGKKGTYRKWLIVGNLIFIALHIVQSHIWYDGLAQDVPVFSSQGSVIVMLVLIIVMENQRRGIFFGKKINKLPLIPDVKSAVKFIRKYHGYFIAWALVYTFWYHPTIATWGHLVGFFYMFLLFIQLSMIYTPVHVNKYWMFTLEVLVLFHGTMVAIGQANNMWPMFMFGFATMAVVTQVYGLGMKAWTRRLIQILYVIGVIVVFGGFTGHRTIDQVHQILWIPIIEYLLVFVFIYFSAFITKLFIKKNT
jgi:hypothetical protein